MPWRHPPNRSVEYRRRAEEARAKAETATDDTVRKWALRDADTWERMAAYEDLHNPPRKPPGATQGDT